MVAPVDAKSVITVDGEEFTFRLGFRAIALGEHLGVDLFAEKGIDFTITKIALLVKCLTVADHPELTEEDGLAIAFRYGIENMAPLILDLLNRFGGRAEEPSAEGKAKPAAKRTRKPTPAP